MQVLVNFDTGHELWVPAGALLLQPDGSYRMTVALADLANQTSAPTIQMRPPTLDADLAGRDLGATRPTPRLPAGNGQAEAFDDVVSPAAVRPPEPAPAAAPVRAPAGTNAAGGGTRLARRVHTYTEEIDEPLLREDVTVHRVPVNEYVDEAPPIRYEDDRIIIPVLEETIVVEKRLLLKENVVVTRRREHVRQPQTAERRSEEVIVGRDESEPPV